MQEQLIVFTRYPVPGKAKTRLIPALGAEGAAELHRQLTESTIAKTRLLNCPISIHFTGGTIEQMQQWLGKELSYYPQASGDLGDRLIQAFQTAFNQGASSVMAIGTDCPGLTPEILEQAFLNLKTHSVTIGAATDGGYYLIGMTQFVPDVFQNIQWSTEIVFQQTIEIVKRLGWSISELPVLNDLDRPEDLQYLA